MAHATFWHSLEIGLPFIADSFEAADQRVIARKLVHLASAEAMNYIGQVRARPNQSK